MDKFHFTEKKRKGGVMVEIRQDRYSEIPLKEFPNTIYCFFFVVKMKQSIIFGAQTLKPWKAHRTWPMTMIIQGSQSKAISCHHDLLKS